MDEPRVTARHTLVLLRHGQSEWNADGIFTGWIDVGLSERGVTEARHAGRLMTDAGVLPTVAHTSLLRRAVSTAALALDEADRHWIPVRRSWRLNERHYGALQGRSKRRVEAEHGREQYLTWRRSFDVRPPPAEQCSGPHGCGPQYGEMPDGPPRAECLRDVMERLLPYWESAVVPDLHENEVVLVVAHGTSLRGLVKHLDQISDRDIAAVTIPTGMPLVYDLDSRLRPVERGGRFLGGPETTCAGSGAVVGGTGSTGDGGPADA